MPTATIATIQTQRKTVPLGMLVHTPGVAEKVPTRSYLEALNRYGRGDWGSLDDEDKATNDAAVREGSRILAAYPIDPNKPCTGSGDNCFWIITEADRSMTTILLPSEY